MNLKIHTVSGSCCRFKSDWRDDNSCRIEVQISRFCFSTNCWSAEKHCIKESRISAKLLSILSWTAFFFFDNFNKFLLSWTLRGFGKLTILEGSNCNQDLKFVYTRGLASSETTYATADFQFFFQTFQDAFGMWITSLRKRIGVLFDW